jgi:hypothetical protein
MTLTLQELMDTDYMNMIQDEMDGWLDKVNAAIDTDDWHGAIKAMQMMRTAWDGLQRSVEQARRLQGLTDATPPSHTPRRPKLTVVPNG